MQRLDDTGVRPPVLAIDIGGTKLAAALVDGAGRLHGRRQAPTAAGGSAEELFALLADLVEGRRIFVEASAAWPFAAITQAAHRLNESVRRERERHGRHGERPRIA